MAKLRAIVAGASGYTGSELVRLLAGHPAADITAFVSASAAGEAVADRLPVWRARPPQTFQPLESIAALDGDVVFFATPHGVAMRHAEALLAAGKVVIDLGADFRLRDRAVFEKWYGEHTAPDLLAQAVYGLSEAAREQIKTAALIACPGCYATAIELALLPFIAGGHIGGDIIADAKSGTSGAGRQSGRSDLLLAEMASNYKAYGWGGHRHLAEILQTLADGGGGEVPALTFVPHLLPLPRGLFVNLYFKMAQPQRAAGILAERWRGNPFVETLADPLTAELAQVIGSNRAILSAHPLPSGQVMLCAALDNLLKGAAGQAVQNMNIRFGLDEACGLGGALPA